MSEEDYRKEYWSKLEYRTPDDFIKRSPYTVFYAVILGLFFGVLLVPALNFLITLYNRH